MKLDHQADVLVIGAGLAGSVAALRAAELGARVILVDASSDTASSWAQGGVVYSSTDDAADLSHDIFEAGCRINNPKAIEVLVEQGPQLVEEYLFKKYPVDFDRSASGALDFNLEAAHSRSRILHVRDHTGQAIMQSLKKAVDSNPRIQKRQGILVDLMLSDRHDRHWESSYRSSRVCGAYLFSKQGDLVEPVLAPSVILATGGFSRLYEHSTGPRGSRGDGIAAAHRVGAKTLHMEYVQFHPTSLYIPGEPRHLLTEALRGAGAKLLNLEKKSFVDELLPRDQVARAIHREMLRESADHMWLDARSLKDFSGKFPIIHRLLGDKGINPSTDLIPVVPAAHYTIGGVWTDTQGATSVPGLFAAGEVACTGLHGANRLASTSLLEALVFGHRAATAAAEKAQTPRDFENFDPRDWVHADRNVDPALLQQDWQLLRRTLWNYVGLSRSEARLKRAEQMISDLRRDVETFYQKGRLSESLIGLRHGVLVATMVLYAALRNTQSLGTHFLESEA